MALDPQTAALLATFPADVAARSMTPAEHRADYEEFLRTRHGPGWVPEPVASSVELEVEGVACRLYRPEAVERPAVLVYLHGGGWIVGGLDSHQGIAHALCARAGIAVLAVDYRLAPEHPFPAPLEDCLTAARWASEQDFASVSVGGDSAGGNLAAAVALVFRAEGRPLACQLLVYPALDASGSLPSYSENGSGYGWESDDMRWYWEQYAGSHPHDDPLLSPYAASDLAGLAPAAVASAEYDLLRDDADRYAERLRDAGVPVWHKAYPGLIHGFFGQTDLVAAADVAFTEIARAVAVFTSG